MNVKEKMVSYHISHHNYVSRSNHQTRGNIKPPKAGHEDENSLRLVPDLSGHEPRSALIAS